jgi:hypothetical protein
MEMSWMIPMIQKRLHEGRRLGMGRRLFGTLNIQDARIKGSIPMLFEQFLASDSYG